MKNLLILFLLISLQGFGQTTNRTSYSWTASQYFVKPITIAAGTSTSHGVNLGQVNTLLATKQPILVNPALRGDTATLLISKHALSVATASVNSALSGKQNVADSTSILTVAFIPIIYSAAGDTSNCRVPGKIGNIFINTSTKKVYISTSPTRGGWTITN